MKTLGLVALQATFCLCASAQHLALTDVSQARESLAHAKGLIDTERTEISGLYDQAAQFLQQDIRWQAQQVGHRRTKAVIENELAAARAAASLPLPGPPPAPLSETAQQVEEESAQVRNDRVSRVKVRDELSKLQSSLTLRGEEITARRAEIREKIQSLQDQVAVLPLASASPYWEKASRTALQAQRQALEQELETLGTEREALDLRRQLIPLQREAHLLRLEADDQLFGELKVRLAKARVQDAKKSLENALAQAKTLSAGFPQLSGIAGDITTYATALWGPDDIGAKSDGTAVQSEEITASIARFKEITANTRRRFQNSGLFSSATEWWPPAVEKFGTGTEVRVLLLKYTAAQTVARRDFFRLEEELEGAPPLETELQRLVAASGKPPGDADFAEFKSRARSMLQLKRNLMTEFLAGGRVYLNRLGEAHRLATELLRAIDELQSFVLQHVLWARSVGRAIPRISDFGNALLWFFSFRSWSQILAGFYPPTPYILLWIAGLLATLALFLFRRRLRMRIPRWFGSNPATSERKQAVLPGILAASLSALPAPLVIAYAGWMIGRVGEGVDLGRAIAGGASHVAQFLYSALFIRRMLSSGGATDRPMGWSQAVRESLDWGVRWLMFVFTPVLFISTALSEEGLSLNSDPVLRSYHNSLGRLCFLLAVLCLHHVGRKVLRPDGAVANALGTGPNTHGIASASASRVAWNVLCSSALLLALLGFYTTAFILIDHLIWTGILTFVLALVAALVRQWMLGQHERTGEGTPTQDEEKARKADRQMRRLTRFGLTLVWIVGVSIIWSTALLALSALKKVELLPEFRVVAEKMPAPDTPLAPPESPKAENQGTPAVNPAAQPALPRNGQPQAAQPRRPLYLSDLLLAVFVGILISMLVNNIPGLLHFTCFRRVALDEGGRYAVTTITRYVAIIAGILAVSGVLGLNWSSVQWLAAALTFGIGFGLQEIFANFASGLILLLDRSIRVGDAVSVGTLGGVVARIQMRATTVTLWDHSDMIVPNKEFITSKLVNWTLSHPETRVDLKVGVGYSSDIEQVREALMRLAQEHPAVLKYPSPQVLLTEFGASAILFELRVFGMYSYGRPLLLDELHRAVVREFRRLGVEIAFPQLDIHLNAATSVAQATHS